MKHLTLAVAMICAAQNILADTALAQEKPVRDTRPIYAFAALPPVGTAVPAFSFEIVAGGKISSESLKGAPTVIAFWSTWCSASRELLTDIVALNSEYAARGVRVVILADDSMPELKKYMDSVGVTVATAAAPNIREVFDKSGTAPERATVRVAWAIPLFMVVDPNGRVAMRDGGPAFPHIRRVLDSLAATGASVRTAPPIHQPSRD